jgi:hypothetical protein
MHITINHQGVSLEVDGADPLLRKFGLNVLIVVTNVFVVAFDMKTKACCQF